jgi:hypothetical protein
MTKEAVAVTATFLVTTFAQQVSIWSKGQKMVKFKIQDLTLAPPLVGKIWSNCLMRSCEI